MATVQTRDDEALRQEQEKAVQKKLDRQAHAYDLIAQYVCIYYLNDICGISNPTPALPSVKDFTRDVNIFDFFFKFRIKENEQERQRQKTETEKDREEIQRLQQLYQWEQIREEDRQAEQKRNLMQTHLVVLINRLSTPIFKQI